MSKLEASFASIGVGHLGNGVGVAFGRPDWRIKELTGLRRLLKPIVPGVIKARLRRALAVPGDWRGVNDLREVTDDPLEALYLSHRGSPVVNIPLSHCRGFEFVGMPFAPETHPFVATLIRFAQSGESDYRTSPLCGYHRSFQPANAAEALGLPDAAASPGLAAAKPFAAVLPWWSNFGAFRFELREKAVLIEAESDYSRAGLQPQDAPTFYNLGPFSKELGDFEIIRLTRTFRAIQEHGFVRDDSPDGDIIGSVVVDDGGDFRVVLHGGQHRAAVAAALGMQSVPVRLFPVMSAPLIHRAEADRWPHVRSGLFSLDQALTVFDRIFAGVPASDTSESMKRPS